MSANDLKPYFRVNSLFFDPNIYGRFLALTMTCWPPCCCGARARRDVALVAAGLALLWAGLVLVAVAVELRRAAGRLAVLGGAALAPRPVLGRSARVAVVVIAASRRPGSAEHRGRHRTRRQGHERPRDLVGGGLRMRATGRCRASAPARSPDSTASASTSAPRAVGRARTRSRSRSPPSRGSSGWSRYLALVAVSLALLFSGLRARLKASEWPVQPGTIARSGHRRRRYAALLLQDDRLRRVPGGPADLGAARDRGRPAARERNQRDAAGADAGDRRGAQWLIRSAAEYGPTLPEIARRRFGLRERTTVVLLLW